MSWKSKAQPTMTLSSSEAKYVALSEAAKEVKFIWMLLDSMGFKVTSPIVVRVDNIGAIFMAENMTVRNRTKHIDIRFRFVNDMVEEGFIEIIFVKTQENIADMFTKNMHGDTAQKYHGKLIEEVTTI